MAISSDIIATPLQIAHELNDLIELRTQQDKRILRNMGVPSFALGFETDANRATAQFVLHAWKESFVDQERMWLKDIVQAQWIVPLWAKALNMSEDEVYDLDAKLTAEFIDYNFDTFSENVDAWLPLVQNGYVSVQDFLDKIGQPELAEKYKELKKELSKTGFMPQMGMQPKPFGGGFGQNTKGIKDDPSANLGGGNSGDNAADSTALKSSELKKKEEQQKLEAEAKVKQAALDLETEKQLTTSEKERRKEIDKQIKEQILTNKRLELLDSIKKKTEELSK
jgi:hypothetical protein